MININIQALPYETGVDIEQHIWVTANGQNIHVRAMRTSHILNTIKCWEGRGKSQIPPNYLGGKEKWMNIFSQELINRQ